MDARGLILTAGTQVGPPEQEVGGEEDRDGGALLAADLACRLCRFAVPTPRQFPHLSRFCTLTSCGSSRRRYLQRRQMAMSAIFRLKRSPERSARLRCPQVAIAKDAIGGGLAWRVTRYAVVLPMWRCAWTVRCGADRPSWPGPASGGMRRRRRSRRERGLLC